MAEALQRGPLWGVVEREVKEAEEHPEEGNRRGKNKDHRVKERIRVKHDEDRTMVQEERIEDLSYNDMEGSKARGREELEEKNRKTKARKRFERKKPNELWQIDIKGPMWCEEQPPEGQHLYLLTMIDDHSRFMIGAKFYTRPVRNHDILSELRKAISKYGKPFQILTDNGSQFYAVNGGTSTFTRWCMQEGIEHIRSRVFHPHRKPAVK